MKLANQKAYRWGKAAAGLGAALVSILATTTVSGALRIAIPATPNSKTSEFARAEFAKVKVRSVLVSIPDRKLALFENGRVVRIYRIAVGKSSTPSPVGVFKIVNRVTNPTYYLKGQVIGAGKSNPVGTRWMGLSAKGYGIHGTNQPDSIGKPASTGCIRMRSQDLEELFELVDIGNTVQIRAERDEQLARVFGAGTGSAPGAEGETETIAQVETEKRPGNGQ
jgi:hypothetical protein